MQRNHGDPELLELLGTDAMGCQREIAAQIIEQGGKYVLGLKGNQSALHEAVKDFFTWPRGAFAGVDHDFHEEVDKDHGRLEKSCEPSPIRSRGEGYTASARSSAPA